MVNNALWLEGWTVNVLDRKPDRTVAEATYDHELEHCPKCGVVGRLYRHGTKPVEYKDIPTFGHPLTIRATVVRYRCRECGATSMQGMPAMDSQRRMTKRLIDYILEQGIEQTYSAVGRHIDVNEKTIRNICDEHVQMAVDRNLAETPVILGIDELTIRKQKRTIFVDVGRRKLLDIIETMNSPAGAKWISLMPNREKVRIVTIDMWGPYEQVARHLLPDATVVTDKWHVVSKANVALDLVRSRFRKTAKGKMKKNPRRGRLIMHKKPEKLSPFRRLMLDAMLENNPLLKAGWEAKEAFYSIWNATDRADAERRFDEWKANIPASVKREFDVLAATVENHRGPIFNYFDYRFTNAYTEARNRIVKDYNRAGRGYTFERIRAKALLHKPITSVPLMLCENCLAMRPPIKYLKAKHLRAMSEEEADASNWMTLCATCDSGFHTDEGLTHDVSSTLKSE